MADNLRDYRILGNVIDALQWEIAPNIVVDAVIDTIGIDMVLDALMSDHKDVLLEAVATEFHPEQVFELDVLQEWARDNYDPEDPSGYEERERY